MSFLPFNWFSHQTAVIFLSGINRFLCRVEMHYVSVRQELNFLSNTWLNMLLPSINTFLYSFAYWVVFCTDFLPIWPKYILNHCMFFLQRIHCTLCLFVIVFKHTSLLLFQTDERIQITAEGRCRKFRAIYWTLLLSHNVFNYFYKRTMPSLKSECP